MGREISMRQIKEQQKFPGKELNEMEAIKIPGTEFKSMVIRILKGLGGRMNDLGEELNKEPFVSRPPTCHPD